MIVDHHALRPTSNQPFILTPNLQFDQGRHDMANTKSAQKAARQMVRRTEINKTRRSKLKTDVRAVEDAITSGDKAKAVAALKVAEPILIRTAQKGIMHARTASRKVSRLTVRVSKMA
jgi:small subunit ribosomal protein S20